MAENHNLEKNDLTTRPNKRMKKMKKVNLDNWQEIKGKLLGFNISGKLILAIQSEPVNHLLQIPLDCISHHELKIENLVGRQISVLRTREKFLIKELNAEPCSTRG